MSKSKSKQDSFAFLRQSVLENVYPEFRPDLFCLKIDLMPDPGHGGDVR